MDWGTAIRRLASQEPPAGGGWSLVHTYFSGVDTLDPAVHPYLRGNGRAARTGWPTSPRIEALRDAWFAADQPETQVEVTRALQRQALEDLPYIPIGQLRLWSAHRRDLTDVPSIVPTFRNIRRV
jgi:peptide/nickel transport system substrate-binding protein